MHCQGHLASFPGSPSFCAIIPRMTFDPPERKAGGEPGRFCHMTTVMPRHFLHLYTRTQDIPQLIFFVSECKPIPTIHKYRDIDAV